LPAAAGLACLARCPSYGGAGAIAAASAGAYCGRTLARDWSGEGASWPARAERIGLPGQLRQFRQQTALVSHSTAINLLGVG